MESGNTIYVAKEFAPREFLGIQFPIWMFPKKEYTLQYNYPHPSLGEFSFESIQELIDRLAYDLSDSKKSILPKHTYELSPENKERELKQLSLVERITVDTQLKSHEFMQNISLYSGQ